MFSCEPSVHRHELELHDVLSENAYRKDCPVQKSLSERNEEHASPFKNFLLSLSLCLCLFFASAAALES
jgi:hypothetical protein